MTSAQEQGGDLVTLTEAQSAFHAETIAAMLADAGIDALVVAPSALDVAISAGRQKQSAYVRVPADQLERAQVAMNEARENLESADWDGLDVGDEQVPASTGLLSRALMWVGFAIAVTLVLFMLIVAVIMVFL